MPRNTNLPQRNPASSSLTALLVLLAFAIALALIPPGWGQTKKGSNPPAQTATKPVAAKRIPDPCKNQPPPVNGVYTVTIMPTGAPKKVIVKPDVVCVGPDETIKWVFKKRSPGDHKPLNWKIEFLSAIKPFAKATYSDQDPQTGPPTGPVDPYIKYKYAVSPEGYDPIDPDVIIKGR